MRYNDLFAVALMSVGLISCDESVDIWDCRAAFYSELSEIRVEAINPKPAKEKGIGNYKGFIANNTLHTLKIVCPYDENIVWPLRALSASIELSLVRWTDLSRQQN